MIDDGTPRNAPATHMHGFLSRDGMPPSALLAIGRDEVTKYGGDLLDGDVTDVVPDGSDGFWVLLAGGRRIRTRSLLVATGLRDELPDVPGLAERWARDVLHCPYCHGHEVRDQQLGVIGGSPGAAERCGLVARTIGIIESTIEQLVIDQDDHLRGVRMTDGSTVPREALFVPPRLVPRSQLLADLGCATNDDGWVTADNTGRTSVHGVWAAGNVVDPRAQVITAAGAASSAAIAINADLVDDEVRRAILS